HSTDRYHGHGHARAGSGALAPGLGPLAHQNWDPSMVSPPARVPRARKTARLMPSCKKCTDPSANRTLMPPGCWLEKSSRPPSLSSRGLILLLCTKQKIGAGATASGSSFHTLSGPLWTTPD